MNNKRKFAVVLTGAPRAVSLDLWRQWVPDNFGTTQGAEIHIFICASNYDSADRYLLGEDPNLAGLDKEPYIDYNHPEKRRKANKLLNTLLIERDSDGYVVKGKRPLNKSKWEKYHRECWEWADSLTFVYWDSYQISKEMAEHFSAPVQDTATWQNQHLLYVSAYHQNKEFFDSLTADDMVYRQRYDLLLQPRFNLWVFAEKLFDKGYTDLGFSLSPRVVVPKLSIVRGKLCADDVWTVWDGPGAKLFAHQYVNYLKQKQEYWDKAPIEDKELGADGVDWHIPEQSIPEFSLQYNYTMYHAGGRQELGTEYFSRGNGIDFPEAITDQYRYHWYDWTKEMVQEIREQCS